MTALIQLHTSHLTPGLKRRSSTSPCVRVCVCVLLLREVPQNKTSAKRVQSYLVEPKNALQGPSPPHGICFFANRSGARQNGSAQLSFRGCHSRPWPWPSIETSHVGKIAQPRASAAVRVVRLSAGADACGRRVTTVPAGGSRTCDAAIYSQHVWSSPPVPKPFLQLRFTQLSDTCAAFSCGAAKSG